MSRPDTKQRLLDAAERLFARQGFHATPLRDITTEAGANVAAVNYHFGSKDGMIGAVLARRLDPLNHERRARIEAVRRAARERGARPEAADVLRAFVDPMFRLLEQGEGGRDFAVLVGRVMTEPDPGPRAPFLRLVGPTFRFLYQTLCEALPHLDPGVVFWRVNFALGAVGHALRWAGGLGRELGSTAAAPPGVDLVPDTATLVDQLVAFIAAGLEAP